MSTNNFTISSGMDVFASDGQKLGTVGDVFSAAPRTEDSVGTPYSDVDSGIGGPATPGAEDATGVPRNAGNIVETPVAGGFGNLDTAAGTTGYASGVPGAIGAAVGTADIRGGEQLTPSDTKYFEVKRGGLLGFGGETLYVPFNAVDDVAPGDNVTLACSTDECLTRFAERPAPMRGEPPAG